MAPRRLLLLLLLLLLGAWGPLSAARRGPPEPPRGNCGMPAQVENAEVSEWSSDSNRLRYSCIRNYKRKAGTSSLAVCRRNAMTNEFHWEVQLSCIRDPSLPATTTEDSRKEAETSNPATLQAAGVKSWVASAATPYGSETASPPALNAAAATTTTMLRTAKPSKPNGVTATTITPELGGHTPGTLSGRATAKFSEPTTSKGTGNGTTAVPSKGAPRVTPQPIERLTGSLSFRIGVPCLVAILGGCLAFFWYCRRSRPVQGQEDILLEERIPMAAERSEAAAGSQQP